jgi:hypothetical protein
MTALSNSTLADRIAALDWSGVSLQHQLAVTAAVETLRKQERGALPMESAERSFSDWITTSKSVPTASNVTPLRAPSAELLRGAEYNERRVTLRRLDGSTVAGALCSRSERWNWIVETTCDLCDCDPSAVGMDDDTVTVDGLPVFSC